MDLAFLHPLYEHPGPWASVYVDTSRYAESAPQELSKTGEALARWLAGQGADEPTCRAVRDAVEDLRHSPEPCGRALFARAGTVVLDPPLATAPGGSSAHWTPLPHTAPLLELAAQEPVCVVAYIERRGAEFELRGAVGSREPGRAGGQQWPPHRTGTGERPVRHFRLRVENTWEHNAAEIADALAVCQEETRADLVILAGEGWERRTVRERLPGRLRTRVIEAPHGVGGRLQDQDVEQIRSEHVRRRADEELERFRSARVPDEEGEDRAVEGVPAVVDAARAHRIDELLLRPDGPDTRREVWVGEDPDQLAMRRKDIGARGERHAWPARADDALVRSVVETRAEAVSLMAAAPDAAPAGGVGALLRREE
ncbi:Vms1/Ankzf1 family peptidyl-tRNA hydrolase [Streptomyces sp. NPDC052040]|uniref:baeRF2 domain-containing protein n=1 Tax=Streptomyces sp. NPDC052040 TaxID=3365682 RepID=UPI0037D10A19